MFLGEKTVVSIPSSLARQLHSYIMDSILQQIEEEGVFTDNSVLEKGILYFTIELPFLNYRNLNLI